MFIKKEPFGVLFLSKNSSLRYSFESYRTKCVDENRSTPLYIKDVEQFNLF